MPEASEPTETPITVAVGDSTISALYARPDNAFTTLVIAHGSGTGMEHPFLAELSHALNGKGIATLRFNFPYREAGRSFPDRPPLALEAQVAKVPLTAGCRGASVN